MSQIHVEDLLLMSINLNMFGAPKVGHARPCSFGLCSFL